MDDLTREKPKAMISVGGKPAIEKMLQSMRAEGIRDISVVRGYKPEAMKPAGVTFFDNEDWEGNGELGSLAAARDALTGEVVVAYGDVIFKRYILHLLLSSDAPITLIVDSSLDFVQEGRAVDRVRVSGPAPSPYEEAENWLEAIGADLADDQVSGQWIGMFRTRGEGTELFREAFDEVVQREGSEGLDLCAVFDLIAQRDPRSVRVIYVQGDWIDINSLDDVARSGDV